jgi:hypothetical protein
MATGRGDRLVAPRDRLVAPSDRLVAPSDRLVAPSDRPVVSTRLCVNLALASRSTSVERLAPHPRTMSA